MNILELLAILSVLPNTASHVIIKGRTTPEIYASIPRRSAMPDGWGLCTMTRDQYPAETVRIRYIGAAE